MIRRDDHQILMSESKKNSNNLTILDKCSSNVDTALSMRSSWDEEEPQKKNDEYVFVRTKDGSEVVFSRRALADESYYFRALFSNDFLESHDTFINLPGIDGNLFFKALNLIPVIQENVQPDISLSCAMQLLPVASYLCMDNLLVTLSKIVQEKVTPRSIVEHFRKASFHYYPLATSLWKKIIHEFQVIFETNNYLKLNEEEFVEAFQDEHLNISAKDELKAIHLYIAKRPNIDESKVEELLNHKNQMKVGDGSSHFPVLKDRVPSNVVMAFGGWSSYGATEVVEIFNTRREKWDPVEHPEFKQDKPRAYHCITAFDDSLFACGGMNGREFFEHSGKYNLVTKTWSAAANMHERRCYLGGASFQDSSGANHVFVGGGFNGSSRLSSCEIYDVQKDIWRKTCPMNRKRSDFALVKVGGYMYAIGGFDGNNIHNDVEFFDQEKEQWYSAGFRMKSGRTGVNAVSVTDNTIVICGGYNGKSRLRSAELYDRRDSKSYTLSSMLTTRSNYGMVCFEDKIYVAGGFDGIRTTAHVEKYSIRAGKWMVLPDLKTPKSALKLLHMDNVEHNRFLVNFDCPGN
ncbi:unnamed protein product [Auanema sp. JU1783]|nr:unnamed protein product [Auanema sp. JU1783]